MHKLFVQCARSFVHNDGAPGRGFCRALSPQLRGCRLLGNLVFGVGVGYCECVRSNLTLNR